MTDTTPNNTRPWLLALAVALIAAATSITVQSCSPEAQQIAAPIAAVAPTACHLLPPGSAEREVCDASARLAAALQRLAAERNAPPPETSSAPASSAAEAPSASAAAD